jgi:O-antigen/teichoic acid export membrane protein
MTSAMAQADGEAHTRFTAVVVRGATFTGAGYVLTQAITLVSYVILARLAGPAIFGAFAAAWIIVGVGTLLTESGMSAALIQRNDRLEEAAATAVVSTFLAGVALVALAVAFSPLVGLYFGSREIGLLSAALAGVLLLNSLTVVPDALMRRRFSFVRRVVVDPLNALTFGAAGAAALATGMDAWGLVLATYVAGVVRVAAVWIFNWWLPDLRKASFRMWLELASYARHVVVSELLREINGIATTALIGRFIGIAPLGAYRFAWRIATQAVIPVAAASAYVLLPAFARISHDSDRFREAFLRSARLLAVIVFPISLALLPLGEQVVVILLGSPWRTAGPVLAALAGMTAAMPLIGLATEVFKAANRPELLPRLWFVCTLGTLILIAAFLPLGVAGVAGGISIAFLFAAAYGLRNIARVLVLPVRAILAEFWKPALASAVMAGALALFAALVADVDDDPTLVRLGWLSSEVLFGALVYGVLLLKLAPATVADLTHALRTVLRGSSLAQVPQATVAQANPAENARRSLTP